MEFIKRTASAVRAGIVVCALSAYAAAASAQSVDAGLQTMQLEKSGDGYLLNLALQPEARCMFGDLDAISLDLNEQGGTADLQATAEVLGASADQIFYGTPNGGSYTVSIPDFRRPTVLGLFLCSAAKQGARGPCSRKKLLTYRQMLAPYTLDMSLAGSDGRYFGTVPAQAVNPNSIKNRIYFFRFAIVEGGKLEFPGKAMSETSYDTLIAALQSRDADIINAGALRETLQRFGGTLGSEPLVSSGRALQFTLPYYSAKKCAG